MYVIHTHTQASVCAYTDGYVCVCACTCVYVCVYSCMDVCEPEGSQ